MTTATKMTRAQMIEKLMGLHVGATVRWQGKTYTIVFVEDCGGKLCRRDTGWLEEGKPATYLKPGKYLAAGKMLEFSNVEHRTLYAQPMYMDFEIVA